MFCAAQNSIIMTQSGSISLSDLRVGSKVFTRDKGMQEITAIAKKTLDLRYLIANPRMSPVTIKAGALGEGSPAHDLQVSPGHRIFTRIQFDDLLIDASEALISAKELVGAPGITQSVPNVATYLNFMFEEDELIMSDGVWSESLFLDGVTKADQDSESHQEIFEFFPELEDDESPIQ